MATVTARDLRFRCLSSEPGPRTHRDPGRCPRHASVSWCSPRRSSRPIQHVPRTKHPPGRTAPLSHSHRGAQLERFLEKATTCDFAAHVGSSRWRSHTHRGASCSSLSSPTSTCRPGHPLALHTAGSQERSWCVAPSATQWKERRVAAESASLAGSPTRRGRTLGILGGSSRVMHRGSPGARRLALTGVRHRLHNLSLKLTGRPAGVRRPRSCPGRPAA
jgi:hypothetical protein